MDWSGTKGKKKKREGGRESWPETKKFWGSAEDKQLYTNGEVSVISLILA